MYRYGFVAIVSYESIHRTNVSVPIISVAGLPFTEGTGAFDGKRNEWFFELFFYVNSLGYMLLFIPGSKSSYVLVV